MKTSLSLVTFKRWIIVPFQGKSESEEIVERETEREREKKKGEEKRERIALSSLYSIGQIKCDVIDVADQFRVRKELGVN